MQKYPLGKTPLQVRMERWAEEYTWLNGHKPAYIPIHPLEYAKLADSLKFSGIATISGTCYQMLPLGVRVSTRMEQPEDA